MGTKENAQEMTETQVFDLPLNVEEVIRFALDEIRL